MKLRRVIINIYFFISILTIFIMCIFIKEYKTKINELDMKKYAIKKLNLYDNIEQKLKITEQKEGRLGKNGRLT